MKVVVCKNCGAKYQLDDSEDISSFECSICTGSLEELETYSQDNDSENYADEIVDEPSSLIVCCVDCGLKFELDSSDDINDFECTSCDGSLVYVDDKLNKIYGLKKEVSKEIIDEPVHEVEILDSFVNNGSDSNSIDIGSEYFDNDGVILVDESNNMDNANINTNDTNAGANNSNTNNSGSNNGNNGLDYSVNDSNTNNGDSNTSNTGLDHSTNNIVANFDETDELNDNEPIHEVEILDSFVGGYDYGDSSQNLDESNLFNNQSSYKSLYRNISNEEKIRLNETKNSMVFNSVEEYEQYKLAIFNHYNNIKDSMKYNYISALDNEIFGTNSMSRLFRSGRGVVHPQTVPSQKDIKKDFKSQHGSGGKSSLAIMIGGVGLIILGIVLYFLTLKIMLLLLLVLGLILIVFGAYKKSDVRQKEVRSKIIRDKLEELPNNFYIFYYTKPPYAKDALNHVVVGPTGVYTILSQKYASKDKFPTGVENGSVSYKNDIGDYVDKKNNLELTVDYKDPQNRFQFGNEEIRFNDNSKTKHKSLTLNEDLAIFLDKMGLSGVYIEPLIGFINDDVAIINVVLTNEDLFLDELLYKIVNGPKRLDDITVMKIAKLLSNYSINCAML